AVAGTIDATRQPSGVTPSLHFRVSADEEYVELTVDIGGETHRLPPRAHQYTLLVLARARLDDAPDMPESEQGWVYTADLARQLRVTMNRLYVTLHRCRKELEAVVEGAERTVIEKRVTTRQVRMGWSSVAVGSL
ncbi:MAG: FHA domain-containing protein, partial [Myxococcota bacterium]